MLTFAPNGVIINDRITPNGVIKVKDPVSERTGAERKVDVL